MTDQQVCPIDGTRRVGAYRYCRTCNFDFETAPALPPAPSIPATAPAPTQPVQAASTAGPATQARRPARPPAARPQRTVTAASAPQATETASRPTVPPVPPAPVPPAPVQPPAPPPPARELTAAERWQALTAQVDATQGWTPPPVDPPAQPHAPIEHDPELGWDAVDESERIVPSGPGYRSFTPEERRGAAGLAPTATAPGAQATSVAAARAAATTGAIRAVETARVVGATVAREVRRYDRTVASRWPKRRWLIHGATGVAALLILAIPLSAAPATSGAPGAITGTPTRAPTAVVPTGLRIDEPANGSHHATDRVTFRGTGPAGAAVVQDVPLADDPRTTIGADGAWSLDVALGPGENLITLRLGDDRATQVVWTLTSTLPAITPSPEPTPVPRAIVPPAGAGATFKTISLKGTGAGEVAFDIPQEAIAIAGITHKGKGAFRVTALGADGQPTQVLVDDRETYRGTVLFDVDLHSVAVRIEANGAWTITIKPVGGAKLWDGAVPLDGTGSAVTRLATPAGPSTAATVTHDGSGSFVLVAYRLDGREALIETGGQYSGAIVIPEGTVLFEIVTRGAWRIALG